MDSFSNSVHYFLKFKEKYFLVFLFFHNYTCSMQSMKNKSGEEFAYFVCQLQTCARTIYRNSRTWGQKIYLLSPAKVFDFKWKLVRRDKRTVSNLFALCLPQNLGKSLRIQKEMKYLLHCAQSLLKFLVLSFCQKGLVW